MVLANRKMSFFGFLMLIMSFVGDDPLRHLDGHLAIGGTAMTAELMSKLQQLRRKIATGCSRS